MWTTLVFLFAASWASAVPDFRGVGYPEDIRGSSSRIVSGWEASEGQFPYILSLRMVNQNGRLRSCGGSLIHHLWVLTAGHCIDFQRTVIVRAGTVDLTRPGMMFEAVEHLTYPTFMDGLPFTQVNDIGIIKLNYFVEYSDTIQPIRLQPSAHKDRDYSGINLIASGWGSNWTLKEGGVSPDVLNWVSLVGESNENCLRIFNFTNVIIDSTICAGPYNVSSQSTCDGDSGGPLAIIDVDGRPTLIGVTSFVSSSGCHKSFPGGFIRPGYYHDWIFEVTGINFDWNPESMNEPY